MMINKRLISEDKQSIKYILLNVLSQWISLGLNICMIFQIAYFLENVYKNNITTRLFVNTILVVVVVIFARFICSVFATKMSYNSSKAIKIMLRDKIYQKLLSLGTNYNLRINTSEVVQVATEGVDQLENYFGSYLPQFFYSLIAPITLFGVLSFINLKSAVILLICVPLIPISIALVQTFAKKLLAKYWGQYTSLGDSFLENLQGLTTLKIYSSDEYRNVKMNEESEKFRKITMKVLTMQLNSVTIMDLIAYDGAGIGIIVATSELFAGNISLAGCLVIILLSADFFIPMRLLGSFFHIAMNGMAASEKIFNLLDLEIEESQAKNSFSAGDIEIENLNFSYDGKRQVLQDVNIKISHNKVTAIVGESGSGKSTIASIISGKNKVYSGNIGINNIKLSDIKENELTKSITYLGHSSYIFKGTVRENLKMGNNKATNKQMMDVLKRVNLYDFIQSEEGLDTKLLEKGENLSGGQRQRLALARAILKDSEIYIFDEATSNIDAESENDIIEQIYSLNKTVILITHRLYNALSADKIYTILNGKVVESGTHEELISNNFEYAKIYSTQINLENFANEEVL